jgi:t-SNARE complex subunit (syntaxin)
MSGTAPDAVRKAIFILEARLPIFSRESDVPLIASAKRRHEDLLRLEKAMEQLRDLITESPVPSAKRAANMDRIICDALLFNAVK